MIDLDFDLESEIANISGKSDKKEQTLPGEIELGDKVVDIISGHTGVVYQIAECLHGCRRIQVEADKLKDDGTMLDGWWMDEHRLAIVKKAILKPIKRPGAIKTGGPNTKAAR